MDEQKKNFIIHTFKRISRKAGPSEVCALDSEDFLDNSEEITIEDLIYALEHKEEFDGVFDKVNEIEGVVYTNSRNFREFTNSLQPYYQVNSEFFNPTVMHVGTVKDILSSLEDSEEFSNLFKNIKKVIFDKRTTKEDTLQFIETLKESGFNLETIEVTLGISGQDRIALECVTGVKITSEYSDSNQQLKQSKAVFTEFYSALKEVSNIDKSAVEIAAKKASESSSIPLTKCLRLLSEFDWDFLGQENIQTLLQEVRSSQKEAIKTYHLKIEEGLHFYMVEAGEHNKKQWQEYAYSQSKIAESSTTASTAQKNCETGISDFDLSHYDSGHTEVWIAFIADKELRTPEMPNYSSIEMCVSAMVPRGTDIPFVEYAGIFRGTSYKGENHRELSTKLHGFIAEAIIQNHPEKYCMFGTPAPMMRKIISSKLEELFGNDTPHIYVGGNNVKYPEDSLEILEQRYKNAMESNPECWKTPKGIEAIGELHKNIILSKQKSAIDSGKLTCPLVVEPSFMDCSHFVVKDENGKVLCDLGPEGISKFDWLFGSRFFKLGVVPLVTIKLADLAGLVEPHDAFEYSVETIGGCEESNVN